MITDPRFAPRRDDLPWLRRRRVPKSARATAEDAHQAVTEFVTGRATSHEHPRERPPERPPERPSDTQAAVADFVARHSTGHPPETPATPAASVTSAASSASLDLDESPATPVTRATPATPARPAASVTSAASSASLDLDESPAPPARPDASSASLDLDERTPTPAQRPAPAQPAGSRTRQRRDARVKPGERRILTVTEPTVTLTRLQSGIGTLIFEAACSDVVGDLRIGAAYELHGERANTGLTSTAQLTQGHRLAPPRSRRPILVCSHDRFERIEVDLRQCTDLRRLVIYAFSEGRQPLDWGGTLITTTSGGGRVELPLDSLQSGDSAALLSLYNVRGEFVLRAEMLTVFGDVREVCRNYGFDRITWLDDRTPVD